MNIQPRKPDGINGSDYIENHPELSQALKHCAKLRAQFLPYFVDGTFIADCILTEPCPQFVVTAYVLSDKVLILAMNTAPEARQVRIACDLAPWLQSASGRYRAKRYDEEGEMTESVELPGGKQNLATRRLNHLEIALFEAVPR